MKYLKVDPNITTDEFNQMQDKIASLGLKSFVKMEHIKPKLAKPTFIRGQRYIENKQLYIYRSKFLKDSVYAEFEPPKKYNVNKGIYEIDGEEITIEEFLKI